MKDSNCKKATLLALTLNLLNPAWAQQATTQEFLGNISEQLDQHEHSLSTLAYLKNYEKALKQQVDDGLKDKNLLIQEYQQLSKGPRAQNLSFQARFHLERQKREVSTKLQDKNKDVQKLEEELAHKKFKYQSLEKLFVEQERNFHHTVDGLTQHIEQLTTALDRKEVSPAMANHPDQQKIIDDYFLQLSLARKMKGELEIKTQTISHYKEELGLKNQSYDQLIQVNRRLNETLTHAENKVEYLLNANKGLKEKLVALESDYSSLERYAINLENDFSIKETKLHGEIAAIQQQFQQYKLAMSSRASSGRYPASVIQEAIESSKDEVSQKIREKLEEAKISMKKYSDNQIAIVLDDQYYFSSNERELNALNQAKLNALISMITEELFGNEQMKDKLISFDIIGHASPRYQSAYVHPTNASHESYIYNLDISLERAQRLSEALFSEDFGDFPHKNFLRQKLRVIGKSFSNPVSKREIASAQDGPCGPFDCQKSRRVEIIFQLESLEMTKK